MHHKQTSRAKKTGGIIDYCTKHLNLSEGSAYRRIQVAKVCNKFPQILEALSQNQISLTVASQLAPYLKEENLNCCNTKERNRYIPDETREIVLERANYQCEYHSESGIRCDQRTHLEIDHIILFAFGGSNDPENLRVLCKSHNLFEAQKHFPRFYEKHF